EQPALCLSCHNGTGATADVVDGVQFVPSTWTGTPTSDTVLGALRGGGFSYALLNSGAPDRLSYSSRGSQTLTFGAAPGHFAMTLTWAAFGTFGGGSMTFWSDDTAATVQAAATTLFGFDPAYRTSTGLQYMSGLPAGNANVVVTATATAGPPAVYTFTFAPHNGLRLDPMPLPSVTNGSGTSAVMTNGISIGEASRVGVLSSGTAVTSTHLGTGTVWGNGPQGQGNAGATGVTLECTNCHNPHGNGQYRILNTLPGEDWASGTGGVASWTDPTNDVEVIDGAALTGSQVHNYTVKPGYLATDVTGLATAGDYFRYKWDPTGATNFTNFYLLKDPMNSGWNGQTPTNEAAIASIPDTTLGAALSATGTSATVASTAGMPTHTPTTEPQPLFLVKIDSEIITANVTDGTHLKLSRGAYGTTAVSHTSGTAVSIVRSDSSDPNAYLYNNTGRMTAWCIACHTRYNGWAQNGTSSLNAQTPSDAIFGFKHGTTSTGCEQCHVNHGTNAVMSGITLGVDFPDGSNEDSALLKVNNRGTCQLCHDPTGTVLAGNKEGTVPVTFIGF
ncbi:MAG: hypothetical protein HY263_00330, partial [Chloroflexi bacterium]|nr:hypothetical protein [Chloroflexota bacterium]